jgi:hypothetical protein
MSTETQRDIYQAFNEDDTLLFADGLDDAIIGVGERCSQPNTVIYSYDKVIEILMQRDGMSFDDATEFFSFNIGGAWVGECTPIWMHTVDTE